jgi:hypothetical protein
MADADDGLSMELDAMYPASQPVAPPTGWHGRRLLTFGASEVPALLIALGMEQADDATPGYVLELAERLIDIKAGLRKPRKAGAAADRGSAAETQVVESWNAGARGTWPAIQHASAVPREWLPLVDRHAPHLSCTPDAWCRIGGELINVQIKTDVRGGRQHPDREWCWQVQAECAVTGAGGSILLYAPGWASWRQSDRGALVGWVVERDDAIIERIREATTVGWQRVETLKATAAEQPKTTKKRQKKEASDGE